MPARIVYGDVAHPAVSIVIPSFDGHRGGNVPRLIDAVRGQTVSSVEIILSVNEYPNGHARNVGIAAASPSSRVFAFFDDDVELGSTTILERFLQVLKDRSIGLVGASQLPPPESTAVQRWIGYDLNKAKFPIQLGIADTEMATHAGMACRREVWEELGGESDTLVTGTDTDLRERMRAAGYRVVVAPQTLVFHPLPTSVGQVLKSALRNGWHQLDYRRANGYQHGLSAPFSRVDSAGRLAFALLRETAGFFLHVFINRERPRLGFRPLNAAFRFLMVGAYSVRAFRERDKTGRAAE